MDLKNLFVNPKRRIELIKRDYIITPPLYPDERVLWTRVDAPTDGLISRVNLLPDLGPLGLISRVIFVFAPAVRIPDAGVTLVTIAAIWFVLA